MAKGKRGGRGQTAAAGGKRSSTTSTASTAARSGAQTAAQRGNTTSARPGARPTTGSARANTVGNAAASKAAVRAPLGTGAARRRQQQMPWWRQRWAITVFGTLAGVAVVIGLFVAAARNQATGSSGNSKLASASLVSTVTGVSQQTSETINTGGLPNPFHALPAAPALNGPTGKPEVLYYGAEYCPYCAAERWSMIVALSRFGTFSNLHTTTSSGSDVYPNTPTFTFYGSTYASQYLDFVPVEAATRDPFTALQTPTDAQQAIFNKYDAPPYVSTAGGIPFVDYGNQFYTTSSGYSPKILGGYTWDQIAGNLNDPHNGITKAIVGNANYITAALCKLTNDQPGAVCAAPAIQQIEAHLPKS